MKQIMEYHIISGRIIETRRVYMAARSEGKKKRGTRVAGNTSMRKIAINERDAVKRLARTLNANFFRGFLFVTLKYANCRLPESWLAAQEIGASFLNKARKLFRRETGNGLRYVAVTANWSQENKRSARLHHHLVMDPDVSMDMLSKLWPEGEFYVRRVSNPGDLTGLAIYLLDNVKTQEGPRGLGLTSGKKKYTTSKGLIEPIRTEPKPVAEIEGVEALPGTFVLDGEQSYDEDGKIIGSYLRAAAQEPPKVRGTMVILPRRSRKRRAWDEGYLAEIRRQDE